MYGIKRIEGRGWPTQHRGRLWIHATSQQPTDADIQARTSLPGLTRLIVVSVPGRRSTAGGCGSKPASRPPTLTPIQVRSAAQDVVALHLYLA